MKSKVRIALWWLGVAGAAIGPRASAAEDWPEFRGPTGQGISTATGLPVEWSVTKNVKWKIAIPGAGWSSPVLSGGRIFLTTGVENASGGVALSALAFDATTGKRLWQTEIFSATEASGRPQHDKNSPASPTPIVEGDRVYVHFGHQGTACLDRAGKILWRNNRLPYDPVHGNGGSPAIAGDLLVFSRDGARVAFVTALDKTTGKLVWETARAAQARNHFSFCTPLVITVEGRTQIISPGSGVVEAFDPKDGHEIWQVRYGGGYSVVPRPVFAHGLLFVATGYDRADLLAIRVGGEGDVTDTHVTWRTTKGAPLTPSVLVVGDELYGVSDSSVASCWDARTGKVYWQERIGGNYSASPVAAEGRIYFQNEEGVGTVIKAGTKFQKLAKNDLGERTLASYAVGDGVFFIRTAEHLFCVGGGPGAKKP